MQILKDSLQLTKEVFIKTRLNLIIYLPPRYPSILFVSFVRLSGSLALTCEHKYSIITISK